MKEATKATKVKKEKELVLNFAEKLHNLESERDSVVSHIAPKGRLRVSSLDLGESPMSASSNTLNKSMFDLKVETNDDFNRTGQLSSIADVDSAQTMEDEEVDSSSNPSTPALGPISSSKPRFAGSTEEFSRLSAETIPENPLEHSESAPPALSQADSTEAQK
jgi:hypothetical protein